MLDPNETMFFVIIILWKYCVTAQCGEEEVCLQFDDGLNIKDANNAEREVTVL